MHAIGKMLIVVGSLVVLLGIALTLSDKIPFFGKLPGDINIKRENVQFYFPLASGLVLSLILSLIVWIFSQFKGH